MAPHMSRAADLIASQGLPSIPLQEAKGHLELEMVSGNKGTLETRLAGLLAGQPFNANLRALLQQERIKIEPVRIKFPEAALDAHAEITMLTILHLHL